MSKHSRFFPDFGELPQTLPVFPLKNVIVMPGAELPLNVFEERYLNMVEDALRTQHMFGMIQPDPSREGGAPVLYRTGCAGRITAYSETPDGRILLSLTGLIRFDIVSELPTVRGYRMVVPDWSPYHADLKPEDAPGLLDRSRITNALGQYLKQKNMETDWQALEKVPPLHLVNTMATLLPISAVEKQAILEAREPDECADILLTILEMSVGNGAGMSKH